MAGTMRAAALIGAAIWPPAAMTTTAAEMLPSLATLQREVAEQLRDPPTVRFRHIHIAHGADGKDRVCGDVNSRNAFAGYSGFLPFVSDILPDKRAGFPFIGTDWAGRTGRSRGLRWNTLTAWQSRPIGAAGRSAGSTAARMSGFRRSPTRRIG